MKKYSITTCVCTAFTLLLLVISALTFRFVLRTVPRNLIPYIYLPLLIFCALFLRAYADLDFVFYFELGKTSIESDCVYYVVSYLPCMFNGLALALNLTMWLDFVFCSFYSV